MSNPLFARFFDRFVARDKGRGEDALRRELLAGLRGEVVEVGPGNGINFEHYPAAVERLLAVEPEPYLRGRAAAVARSAPVPVTVLDGSAAALPLASASVDAVVVAGVLCSVPTRRRRWPSSAASSVPAASCASTSTCARAAPPSPATRPPSTSSGRG